MNNEINWYQIFYYVAMADGIKQFFNVFSNITTWFTIISFVIMMIIYFTINGGDYDLDTKVKEIKAYLRPIQILFYSSLFCCMVTWIGYIACPSKKDSLIIIAGGTVGNFITSDSSAKQLPAEVLMLLRTKIKSEIEDLNKDVMVDTLASKSREELIKMIKAK